MNKFDAMMAYLKTYHRQHGQAGAPGPPPSPLSAPMPPPPPPPSALQSLFGMLQCLPAVCVLKARLEQVVALEKDFALLTRVWCVAAWFCI